jgi:1,4-dihydroxy-6-naphthoate synthase
MKSFSLGYSPCPNDTFIFYAMIHGRIDTRGISFNEILLDVETLNQKASRAELDVTKVSYAAYLQLRDKYTLLRSGGALGRGCGPLIVARDIHGVQDLRGKKIAVPGLMTTAFLLLRLYDSSFPPDSKLLTPDSEIIPMPFDRIMDSVSKGETDAGLIIHESRFTYPLYGLKKVIDLGEWWEQDTGLPIPLGGILAKRSLGADMIKKIDEVLKQSVQYAFSHRDETKSYIKQHAQELSDDVIDSHIELYVNEFSVDLGDEGEAAVRELISRAEKAGI